MLYYEADDGRILLVLPFQGMALVGSTDIPDGDPDRVACSDDETAYFIQSLRDLLPGLDFNRDQIVFAYAGIRPLPNSRGVSPGLISRDHSAPHSPVTATRPFPIISLVGGKWTTFRAFSAEVADMVLSDLNMPRLCDTDDMPIGGARAMPRDKEARDAWIAAAARDTGASPNRVSTLLARYGTTGQAIARHEGARPIPLADAPKFTVQEIDWIVRNERVMHLADLLVRRTPLAISGALTGQLCRSVASIVAAALHWSTLREEAELDDLKTLLAERHGVHLELT